MAPALQLVEVHHAGGGGDGEAHAPLEVQPGGGGGKRHRMKQGKERWMGDHFPAAGSEVQHCRAFAGALEAHHLAGDRIELDRTGQAFKGHHRRRS